MKYTFIKYFLVIVVFSSCNRNINCSYLKFNEFEKITLKNDRPYTGKCTSNFPGGKKESVRSYLDGKDHGNWVFFHMNGKIATKGEMYLGKKINKWLYYYENGEIMNIQNYDEQGNKIGNWINLEKNGDTISILKF